jgi:hypothetical protein
MARGGYHGAGLNDEAAVERDLEIEAVRALLPRQWLIAFLEPECFYCGIELDEGEYDESELPHERICQKCHDKESAEIY